MGFYCNYSIVIAVCSGLALGLHPFSEFKQHIMHFAFRSSDKIDLVSLELLSCPLNPYPLNLNYFLVQGLHFPFSVVLEARRPSGWGRNFWPFVPLFLKVLEIELGAFLEEGRHPFC